MADNGPATWPQNFAEFCAGIMQSPINYMTNDVVITDPGQITLMNWDVPMTGQLTNNGHSLVFDFTGTGTKPTITGGRLGSRVYEFLQLHWHWGSDSTMGSEHTVDGKEYPLELHIVNVNTAYGPDWINFSDGLAVLGFFYDVHSEDNGMLAPLLSTVQSMARRNVRNRNRNNKGRQTPVTSQIRLDSLISPAGLGAEYFYYQGGLTTPDCNEIVLWTSFLEPLLISEAQLEIFRTLTDSSGVTLNDNFRPPTPLGTRTVGKRVPGGAPAASTAPLSAALAASGTAGGFVLGAAAVLAASALAPLLFPPARTARAGARFGQTQREDRLSQFQRLLQAGQDIFGP